MAFSRRMPSILIVILLGLVSPGTGLSQVLEQTFSDSTFRFKISVPPIRWKFGPREIHDKSFQLTMRFESPVDRFIPNVNLQILPSLDESLTLQKWVEEELKNLPPSLTVLEKKKISHQGHKGLELLLKQAESKITIKQWLFLIQNQKYILTCSAQESSFPLMVKDFEKILGSFEIINENQGKEAKEVL